jgi:hypothetical protein
MIHAEPEIKTLFSLSQDCALINQLCVVVVVTLSLSLSLCSSPTTVQSEEFSSDVIRQIKLLGSQSKFSLHLSA